MRSKAGHLAGAGLDVFEHEPQVDPRLITRDDVVLTPHLGGASREARKNAPPHRRAKTSASSFRAVRLSHL